MSQIVDLFGRRTAAGSEQAWRDVLRGQECPFRKSRCVKVRKSAPEVAIGTCTVRAGKTGAPIVICPFRLLQRRQIFVDSLHLLGAHEPGNELHVIPEVAVPGGSVDYFLVSAQRRRVVDFAGIEIQALDTTGTIWPARQRFLRDRGVVPEDERDLADKPFGINWKMTAKTILMQLHHKVETFDGMNKRLVLVLQDHLMEYMQREFSCAHLESAKLGNAMHFHVYAYEESSGDGDLRLAKRKSTDAPGVAACLNIQAEPNVEMAGVVERLEAKISDETVLQI